MESLEKTQKEMLILRKICSKSELHLGFYGERAVALAESCDAKKKK